MRDERKEKRDERRNTGDRRRERLNLGFSNKKNEKNTYTCIN